MRLSYVAGFMIYLVLSLVVIMPVQVSAFNATITGAAGVENIREELDITNIYVIADSPVSIESVDGQTFAMQCSENQPITCSYSFPENTLPPGAHTLKFHQENGTPQTLNQQFYVDTLAPELNSFAVEEVQLEQNVSNLIGNKLNLSFEAKDPLLTINENSCAGIQKIILTSQTDALYETTITPNCNLAFEELIPIQNIEGELLLFLTLIDAIGNSITQEAGQLTVDFSAPKINEEFSLLLAGEEVTTVADQPQLFPYVDVRFSIDETNLSEVLVDASSLTANPAVFPTYKALAPECQLQGSTNICYLRELELNPSSGNIYLEVRARDQKNNLAIKNITKELEVVDKKGEVTFFSPLSEHCDEDICYLKKGSNKIQLQITHDQGILPSLITILTQEVSTLPKIKASRCNETAVGEHTCFAYVPVITEETGVRRNLLLTTPSTDINGNALKGIMQTQIMIDTVQPNMTSELELSDTCPTAGMTATVNVTVKEETSSKVFIKAETNKTTGGYNFTNDCKDNEDGTFFCEVLLQQFVSYPEEENITITIEDLAGNKQSKELPLRVCQSETQVAPESIRNIQTSTTQTINKRIASATTTKVFLPLTFQVQSAIAPKMEILAIETDGCINTQYAWGDPYFINEKSFVRNQELTTNRGELLLVVPIGKQNIMEDEVIIDCNLSIYQVIGNTRYMLPEKQQVTITLDTYNNPLGSISNTTAQQLNEIKTDIKGLNDEIEKKMKLHGILETICTIADLVGKVTQAVSIIESAVYVVALGFYPFSASLSDKIWSVVCTAAEKFRTFKDKLFKDNPSESLVGMGTQVLKLGCTLYRCGLCTIDGLMATVNMAVSIGKYTQNDDKKATKADELGLETEEAQALTETATETKSDLKDQAQKLNEMKEANANWEKNEKTPDSEIQDMASQDDDFLEGQEQAVVEEYAAQNPPPYSAQDIKNQEAQVAVSTIKYVSAVGEKASYTATKEEQAGLYNQYVEDSFTQAVDRANSENSPWILDPYKSKTYAGVCLCNSGMIYALNKERQLKCREYTCIQNAASQGLPITECLQDYKVASCLYVEGAMTKRVLIAEIWGGIKNGLLKDPVKTVRMGICIDEYLPVNTGLTKQTACQNIIMDWRTVFCTLTDAYLHLRDVESLLSNPFEKAPLAPEGTDFCAGVELT